MENQSFILNQNQSTAKRYMMAAEKLIAMLDSQESNDVSNGAIQPIMPAGVSACSPEGTKNKS